MVLVLAQYLTARYILAPQIGWWDLIFDFNFFTIVMASALTSAAGYIINNFYDGILRFKFLNVVEQDAKIINATRRVKCLFFLKIINLISCFI